MSKALLPLCVLKPVESIDHIATGAKMRALRETAGLSASEVAERLGMDPGQLSGMESGKRPWSEDKAARYVSALFARQ